MSDAFLGEIRMFAGTFAPQDWKFCDGSVLKAADYNVLFSLIGAVYGGDGITTFALPDLRGRTAVGLGAGPGLTNRNIGQTGGETAVALNTSMVPSHTHPVMASTNSATTATPGNTVILATPPTSTTTMYTKVDASDPKEKTFTFDPLAVANFTGGQAHANVMSSYGMNFIICVNGLYPTRP